GGAYTGIHQHLDAMAVECVESLEFAAAGQEVEAAVGQYAVDIEYGQANGLGAGEEFVAHQITPARVMSWMCRAPMGRSSSSTTTSTLILWSSMIFRASAASMSGRTVLP